MTYLSGNAQAIACKVIRTSISMAFLLIVVYAYNTKEDRKELWEYLETIHQGNTMPWLVMGDFNSVLNINDGIGGNPVTMAEVTDFQQYIDSCELNELPPKGSRHTWSDKLGNNRVYSKTN